MIKVRIGGAEHELSTIDESWVNQQINRRKADGINACVQVIIQKDGLDMGLSTPNCANSGRGTRPPTKQEAAVFELWKRMKLDTNEYSGGNLIAFLKQLQSLM